MVMATFFSCINCYFYQEATLALLSCGRKRNGRILFHIFSCLAQNSRYQCIISIETVTRGAHFRWDQYNPRCEQGSESAAEKGVKSAEVFEL